MINGEMAKNLSSAKETSSPARIAGQGLILVTGGAGFVGANLVRMLLSAGYRVRILDNFSTGQREYLKGLENLEVIQGDILDREVAARAIENAVGVIHLAAQSGVPSSLADPKRDCMVNVLGTLNLLEACRHHACLARFVFASSNAPLGRQTPPITEDKVALPISPYGASKLAGEAYCLAYYGAWGIRTVILRFGNAYGPFSAHKNSVVPSFFRAVLSGGHITIFGDGKQTRDFIYVEDLCRAILRALGSDISGEVFQIATGVQTSIRELACAVSRVVGRDIPVRYEQARAGDLVENYSCIDKAKRLLGWKPCVELEEGLRRTWQWFRQEYH